MSIHHRHIEWLEERGIDHETALQHGIETVTMHGSRWLAVPYREGGRTLNHKYRRISDKAHQMDSGAPLLWWNIDCLDDERVRRPENPVVVTEGEWDALAAAMAGWPFYLSVPNGAPAPGSGFPSDSLAAPTEETDAERYRFFWRGKPWTDRVARFILATDGDGPGRLLAHELVRRLGPERCLFVEYPDGCKDLGDVLQKHGAAAVGRLLKSAKPYPVRGLYRILDFPDPAPVRPIWLSIPGLSDAWPIVPGTLSVVTGFAGQGKTSLILAVVSDLIRQGLTVGMGSFETIVRPVLHDALTGHLCGCYPPLVPDGERERATGMLQSRLVIMQHLPEDDEAEMSLEDMLDLIALAALRDGVRVFVIDPWNELEHKRREGEQETDYAGRAIRSIKRLAVRLDVAIILVAHPRKPAMDRGGVQPPTLYDISGSAHFANKADYGIVVHRRKSPDGATDVNVCKVRLGLPGKHGAMIRLQWDWRQSRYSQCDGEREPEPDSSPGLFNVT